jgi:pyruvate/2-oxoglutarate dehydrogenase complex dihydrolipoamide dehydrogenase (E3) component
MQGFGVAMRMGMTLDDLQGTVGIHPTTAEEIVRLREPSKPGDGPPTVDGC